MQERTRELTPIYFSLPVEIAFYAAAQIWVKRQRHLERVGYGCLFLLALGVQYYVYRLARFEYYRCYRFVPTPCVVLDKGWLHESKDDEVGSTARFWIEFQDANGELVKTWAVHGAASHDHSDQEQLLSAYEVGKSYTCCYNPRNSRKAFMSQFPSSSRIIAILVFQGIAICMFAISIRGIIHGAPAHMKGEIGLDCYG